MNPDARFDPESASPGLFSTTSITHVDRADSVTARLASWLEDWAETHQGPVVDTQVGSIDRPEGIALPFGWTMVWVQVTVAMPDAEPDEVVVELPSDEELDEGLEASNPYRDLHDYHLYPSEYVSRQDFLRAYPEAACFCERKEPVHNYLAPMAEKEYPGLHGSHKPGCVLAKGHREAGTLACYGFAPGNQIAGWLQ